MTGLILNINTDKKSMTPNKKAVSPSKNAEIVNFDKGSLFLVLSPFMTHHTTKQRQTI